MTLRLSRRRFTGLVGAGLGVTLFQRPLFRSVAHARRPAGVPEDAVILNANENPYGPAPAAREAMTRSQSEAARYPDAVEQGVIEAIARHHGVGVEQIVLGCGSGEILRMADLAFLKPGKTVVVAEPTFEAVLGYARVTQAEPIKVSLDASFRHDLGRMAAACDARTGLVYICNPNNPTGTIVTAAELRAFLGRVPRTAAVLVDEAYFHFAEDPQYGTAVPFLKDSPNLIVVRTFSKIYGMAGMRLGYAVTSAENARALREHRCFNNANAAVLAAVMASLDDERHVAEQRRLINQTRQELCQALTREGRRFIPSQANFVMIDVGGDVQPVIEAFRKRHILVGRKFPSLAQWLRVSIGTPKETQGFLAALREIVPTAAPRA